VDSADYNPYRLLYLGAIVLAGPYWKNAQDHGLETPNLALFQQFKKDISEAIAAQSEPCG